MLLTLEEKPRQALFLPAHALKPGWGCRAGWDCECIPWHMATNTKNAMEGHDPEAPWQQWAEEGI